MGGPWWTGAGSRGEEGLVGSNPTNTRRTDRPSCERVGAWGRGLNDTGQPTARPTLQPTGRAGQGVGSECVASERRSEEGQRARPTDPANRPVANQLTKRPTNTGQPTVVGVEDEVGPVHHALGLQQQDCTWGGCGAEWGGEIWK
jgi:hypothetical protein